MKIFYLLFFIKTLFSFSQNQNNNFRFELAVKEFNNQNYKNVILYHLNNKTSNYSLARIELIAKCYNKLEDYYKEIEYLESALVINSNNKSYNNMVLNYIELAKVHKKLRTTNDYMVSVNYLIKAIDLLKITKININLQRRLYNNLGNYYKKLNQYDKALIYHNKAINISINMKDSLKTSLSYSNIASLYLKVNSTNEELNKAEYYLKESLKFNSKPKYYLYTNLGIIRYLKKDYNNALVKHNRALEVLLGVNLKHSKNIPPFEKIKNFENKASILIILYEKIYAWIKYAEQQNNTLFLDEGLKTIDLADQLLDLLFIETKENKTKVYWRKRASEFYFLGLHISNLLNKYEKAFYFSEKSKALMLLNNTHVNKFNNTFKLPEKLKDREIKLKKEIYKLENLNNSLNSTKGKLFEKKLEFDHFLDSLKKEYPKYINSDNILAKTLALKDLRNKINDSTICYISYIWNKTENQFDTLYGLAITKDSIVPFKIKDLKSFENKVSKFKRITSKALNTTLENKDFQQTAYSLYKDLLPSVIRPLIKDKKLVIIPDNDLSNIPFEALVTNANTNNYLLKNHEISYAYSLSFLIENNTINRNPDKNFIGIAPVTFNYDNLQNLHKSETEINNIKAITNGKILLNTNATKQNFFSEINNYKILHLSTHANANDSISPWIAFKNEKLYLNELYTTKNQADLVVLSACNSSLGKLKDGEGVFSLARGFFYSGSKSVVSSLWNVNDKSNATITTSFYKYLEKGKTKSAALRLAKLDYLDTHKLSEASPYYWSSLVLIGDTSSISLENRTLYYIILGVLLLIFFFLKKIKNLGNNF